MYTASIVLNLKPVQLPSLWTATLLVD